MGNNTIDFNRIFFGQHEGHHKILTAVIILFAVALVLLYQSTISSQNPPVARSTSQQIAAQETSIKTIGEACGKYIRTGSEVPCEAAVKSAQVEYGGDVYGVARETIDLGSAVGKQDSWLIRMRNIRDDSSLPIKGNYEIIYAVSVNNGTIHNYRIYPVG